MIARRLARIFGFVLLVALPAIARGAGVEGSADTVPVCDSLIALRQLAAGAGEDRARAAAQVSAQQGCRLVSRDQLGEVQRRAMFGGGAYECLALPTGGCAWVMP